MRQRRKRRFFTAAESAEIWDRWRKGEGLKSIGRVFGKTSSSIFAHISPTGGIRPPPRRRSRLALTLAEREEISRGLAHGHSLRRIACSLERAPSTVSREIARNGGSGPYRAAASDRQAWRRARRPKACKLARHPQLRQVVATQLRRNWSPQQIAGWLKSNHPEDEAFRVSHETIYRSLFVQARGVLKKALIAASAHTPPDPPLAACHRQGGHAWRDPGHGVDPRAAGLGRGSCGAWSLGRRPAVRFGEQLHRHAGRAAFPLCDARQDPQPRHADRRHRTDQAGAGSYPTNCTSR